MFWCKKRKLTKKEILKREKFFQNSNQDEKVKQNRKVSINHKLPEEISAKTLSEKPTKDSLFISSEVKLKVSRYAKKLQSNLYNNTLLTRQLKEQFEELYKMIYYFSRTTKIPKWYRYYDLLFIGEGHALIISKYSFNVGPLLTINEIMSSTLTIPYLRAIFLRLEVIINQMIKLYNEGKNYNYTLIDSVKELKLFGLVSGLLYKKLLLIADVRKKLVKANNIKQIKILNYNGEIERLVNLDVEFKYLLSEVYVDLVSIYTEIQEPYLKKFYYLWKNKELDSGHFKTFYQI